MSQDDVITLAKSLITFRSVSQDSNASISDYISEWLIDRGFSMERLEYDDSNGVRKVNLIAKIGEGSGGLAFCSHSDTVPGQEGEWPAFEPEVRDGGLYGRGSCDMKGPLAATMIASASVDPATLSRPVYIVVTADEEVGLDGAKFVARNSKFLADGRPAYGIIAEPTRLVPVYGHKGMAEIEVAAYGKAAHTSTGLGESANFKIAPFIGEMAALAELVNSDPTFANPAFDPPTNGFNMVIDDGGTRPNVTASKTVVALTFRIMPNARAEEFVDLITQKAANFGLECVVKVTPALDTDPDSRLVKLALELTKTTRPVLVSYGTDGVYLQSLIDELIVLGPGDIAVAHTVEELIPIDELNRSVDIYRQLILRLCTS